MRLTLVMASLLAVAAHAAVLPVPAQGEGLVATPDVLRTRWQARIELDTVPQYALPSGVPLGPQHLLQMTRLLGDYQLDALRFGQAGGLRLTGGLLLNARQPLLAGADSRTWPYLGIGYAGQGARGDWGFSADVGLAAQNPGRVGRIFSGTADLSDTLRELRLQPVIKLGVTYSF